MNLLKYKWKLLDVHAVIGILVVIGNLVDIVLIHE